MESEPWGGARTSVQAREAPQEGLNAIRRQPQPLVDHPFEATRLWVETGHMLIRTGGNHCAVVTLSIPLAIKEGP